MNVKINNPSVHQYSKLHVILTFTCTRLNIDEYRPNQSTNHAWFTETYELYLSNSNLPCLVFCGAKFLNPLKQEKVTWCFLQRWGKNSKFPTKINQVSSFLYWKKHHSTRFKGGSVTNLSESKFQLTGDNA